MQQTYIQVGVVERDDETVTYEASGKCIIETRKQKGAEIVRYHSFTDVRKYPMRYPEFVQDFVRARTG